MAVAVGITPGVITFFRMRKVVICLKHPTGRALPIQYVLMFLGVLLATWVTTFGALSIAREINR